MTHDEPERRIQAPRLGGYLRGMQIDVRTYPGGPWSGLIPDWPKYPRARWRRCWAGFPLPEDRLWTRMLRCRRQAGHETPHFARRRKAEAWW